MIVFKIFGKFFKENICKLFASNKIEPNDQVEFQRQILEHTATNWIVEKYPPPLSYTRQFLKQLVKFFEHFFAKQRDDESFYCEIFQLYTSCLCEKRVELSLIQCDQDTLDELTEAIQSDANIGFVTHSVDELKISVLESNQIVFNGTTGYRTWPAALHLLRYLLAKYSKPEKWQNVIELGSGIGLLGIGLVKGNLIPPTGHFVFTDHDCQLLNRIRLNLAANEVDQSRLSFLNLDWLDENSAKPLPTKVDLILASDVIFDSRLIRPFISLLRKLFDRYQEYPDCLICCTERNLDLLDQFKSILGEYHLEATIVHHQSRAKWLEEILQRMSWHNLSTVDFEENLNADAISSVIYSITSIKKNETKFEDLG